MSNMLKVAIGQMSVFDDKKANLQRAEEMIKMSAVEGCQLIVLPEMFSCPYSID
ncbi:MAG: carbon-nitrogen hydrolase family protein, partial [Syntrophomonadaceae bacterium]|nr:carbon-nitrogen hydrolase family protein [Syntrophomonadaceae bacterium]